jgi:hypothetical protein
MQNFRPKTRTVHTFPARPTESIRSGGLARAIAAAIVSQVQESAFSVAT